METMKNKKPSYKDLVLMVDIFCAAIESGLFPIPGSLAHRMARYMVDKSGCKPRRKRMALSKPKAKIGRHYGKSK